jgi:glutamyl-tRNA reductase
MQLLVVGLNYKTAPVELLERFSISEEQLPKALHQLGTYEHLLEGVILSTCNRVEVYAVVSKFHGGSQDVRNFLSEFCHVAPEDMSDHLYTFNDQAAVRQLFRVASGVDSMLIGESEILGQVKRAFRAAAEEGLAKRVLASAFRRALRLGRKARTETAIGRNPASMSSAAVFVAARSLPSGTLEGAHVAIVGAGKMSRLTAKALSRSGVATVTVLNRSVERAREVAALLGGTAAALMELSSVMSAADVIISSTNAPGIVIAAEDVASAVEQRSGLAPLVVVDIAVPRDVDPGVSTMPGVILRDIDDVRMVVDQTMDGREAEIERVEALIELELAQFAEWERAVDYAPTAAALVSQADAIRSIELARVPGLRDLSPEQQAAVDHLSRRIVSKMLHAPLKNAREQAGSKQGYLYLTLLRELFDLDDPQSEDEQPLDSDRIE